MPHQRSRIYILTSIVLVSALYNLSAKAADAPDTKIDIKRISEKLVPDGKEIVVLYFWHYGCKGCLQDLLTLNRLYTRYRDRGFGLVGIYMWQSRRDEAEEFTRGHNIDWPNYPDENNLAHDLRAVPGTMVYLTPDGRITGIEKSVFGIEKMTHLLRSYVWRDKSRENRKQLERFHNRINLDFCYRGRSRFQTERVAEILKDLGLDVYLTHVESCESYSQDYVSLSWLLYYNKQWGDFARVIQEVLRAEHIYVELELSDGAVDSFRLAIRSNMPFMQQ